MPMNRPGILDEGFLENIPNVMPAGEAPWLKNNPSLTLPEAGAVRPEWNSVWIRPGMLLEPGTGFGSEGRSSALQQMDFPMFPFFFPGMGPFGYAPPPPPSQENPGTPESDYLGTALKAGGDMLKAFAPEPNINTFMGPDVQAGAMQDVWGFSPKDNPNFTLGGQETGGPQFPDVKLFPGENTSFLPPSELIDFSPTRVLGNSPFFGGDVGPAMGFGAEPQFGLSGPLSPGGPDFNLGFNPSLNATPWQSTISPGVATGAGAALAAAPVAFRALGRDDIAGGIGSPAVQAPGFAALGALAAANPATAAATAGVSALAALGPLIGMKIFDVGGAEKRRARDAETVKGGLDEMSNFVSLARDYPELFQRMQNEQMFTGYDPISDARRAEFKRIWENQRIPREATESVWRDLERFNPIRNEILAGGRPDISNINVAPISQGEAWRQYTLRQQQLADQEAARVAEEQRRRDGSYRYGEGR